MNFVKTLDGRGQTLECRTFENANQVTGLIMGLREKVCPSYEV
jgi:hypothetical protein